MTRLLAALLLAQALCLGAFSKPSSGEPAFTFESLDGETRSLTQWPVFIITSHSEADLRDAFRCATFIASFQPQPEWVIDFAWPQPEAAKRRAAKILLKDPFMKSRSTILPPSTTARSLVALINSKGDVLWSSDTYPSDEGWQAAQTLLNTASAE